MTQLRAYLLQDTNSGFDLVPAPASRGWINQTFNGSRCLPLLMANQAGWLILNPTPVRFIWDGGARIGSVIAEGGPGPDGAPGLLSHFGWGIITFTLPYVFRTEEGYDLLVRGPANSPKDGISPLEGLVETDHTVASFTMNWQITRPDVWITFEAGEPIAQLVPQRRGELEEFTPQIVSVDSEPELARQVEQWQDSRGEFNAQFQEKGAEAMRGQWQKTYFDGAKQNRLRLRPFEDRR